MIQVTENILINESEIKLTFMASPGPGGQNVNKVATAVLLRFNVFNSLALSEEVRQRLIDKLGKRLTSQGDLIIKASSFRTQERNKQDAMNRFVDLLQKMVVIPRKRKKTRPSFSSVQRRLNIKKVHSTKKSLRQNKGEY
jgi:ribosome-associated protein